MLYPAVDSGIYNYLHDYKEFQVIPSTSRDVWDGYQ